LPHRHMSGDHVGKLTAGPRTVFNRFARAIFPRISVPRK
jgi:hypothetical protein